MRKQRLYTLTLENRSRLEGLFKWTFTRRKMILVLVLMVVASVLFSGALIALTPLKKMIPGYSDGNTRQEAVEALLRLDSIQTKASLQQQYIDNLRSVFTSERNTSSPDSAGLALADFNPDALLDPSEREQLFISKMNDRERIQGRRPAYNPSPGIFFSSLAEGALPLKGQESDGGVVYRIPQGKFVNAVADGKVVDKYRMQDEGYVLLIQHHEGYLTKYSLVASPLVDKGERVDAGEPIAAPAKYAGRNLERIKVEMWHNGDKLDPSDYIRIPALSS